MTATRRLEGKSAIITGGGSGIGLAAAKIFASAGAKVALIDRDGKSAERAAQEVLSEGGEAFAFAADISEKPAIESAIGAAASALGAVHILCNNAGISLVRSFLDVTPEEIDRVVAINFKGVIYASQAATPHLIRAGGGAIVNTSSNAGLVGRAWQGIYGATKAAVINLTKSMALSLAQHQIRVNCICPGSIDTPMLRGALQKTGRFEEEWRRTGLATPLGRIGRAEDCAYAMLYLASDEAAFVTGVALPVDGGRTVGILESAHLGMDVKEKTA